LFAATRSSLRGTMILPLGLKSILEPIPSEYRLILHRSVHALIRHVIIPHTLQDANYLARIHRLFSAAPNDIGNDVFQCGYPVIRLWLTCHYSNLLWMVVRSERQPQLILPLVSVFHGGEHIVVLPQCFIHRAITVILALAYPTSSLDLFDDLIGV